ncbi:MAG: hypothetical protein CR991_00210 [Proteobacteria bacterium]|nr:MAG: hypothetical protein CR991_00210 [Pseudomonadota bacterium]
MRPADLTVQVRQRSPWEAVDLGFRLTQQHWKHVFPTMLLWFVLIGSVLWLLLPRDYLWLASLIFWWLKPLYDRILLHIYSHSLFAHYLTSAEVFSALPRLITHTGLLGALSWRRFSLSRAYNLPIWQLEQLRGEEKRKRQQLIYLQGHSNAVWLSIICLHLELILFGSLFVLLIFFDPTGVYLEHLQAVFTQSASEEGFYIHSLMNYSFYILVVFIIEPFYVAAGFTLYLNRRTQLEAWDIEIAFRSIGERLAGSSQKTSQFIPLVLLSLTIVLTSLQPFTPVYAAHAEEYLAPERLPPSAAREKIDAVMALDELSQRRKIMSWQAKKTDNEGFDVKTTLDDLGLLFATIFKALLWIAVIVLIIFAIAYRDKLLALLKPSRQQVKVPPKPTVLFGMDIRPESLPEDISGTAKQLWEQGQTREALSLLYRGSLMLLTRQDELAISNSHTEEDILRLAHSAINAERFAYLSRLTRHWQNIAYAHRPPEQQVAEALFNNWPSFRQLATTHHEVTA